MVNEQGVNVADVQGLIERELGVKTSSRQSDPASTISQAAVVIFKPDPRRLFFLFVNMGTGTIFLAPRPGVSATDGIFIPANGGTLSSSFRDDFILPALEWSGLGADANIPFYTLEVLMS